MSKKIALPLFIVLFSSIFGCASTRLSSDELRAVKIAENFVKRNGYTDAGHPDLPVNEIEATDRLFLSAKEEEEKLLNLRRGKAASEAFCITDKAGEVFVAFSAPESGCPLVVKIMRDGATRLMHSCIDENFMTPCKRIND